MPSNRARTSARTEILSMLKADHKRVRKAFRDFEKLEPQESAEQCLAIVQQTLGELQVHATLEEELFYPAARGGLKDEDEELIDEAEVEHMTVKVLIEQLQGMTAEDEKFAATFKVLGEYVNHHIREEENEMFPKLERAKLDWDGLSAEMETRREELTQEFMSAATISDEDMQSDGVRSPSAT
jgi:hemerythrin-like domain-containing protein